MSTHLHLGAAALALIAGIGAAHAQTVITREITTGPVETIVERGPTSTVITRRPLDMTVPRAPVTLSGDTIEPIAVTRSRETVGISTTPVDEDMVVTRRRVQTAVPAPRIRSVTVQRQVRRVPKVQSVSKTAMRPALRTIRLAPTTRRTLPPPPPLTQAQRSVIYRTVVQERVVPRAIITEHSVPAAVVGAPLVTTPAVRQEVITERVMAPPAPVVRERVVTSPYVTETVGAAPVVAERVVTTPASVDLTVGSRVPPTFPLFALPAALGLQLPMIRPYRYTIVNDRVLLVDPATGFVIDEIQR